MLQNKDIETLRMLFNSHNYVMTTAELTASKLYYADIKQLLDEGLIERVRRGYYHWTQDYGESEVVIINRLFPDAVLCMEIALFYYRYSDRNPAEWNFAIDKNVSKRRTKIDYPFIKAYRVESELVTLGETEGESDFRGSHRIDELPMTRLTSCCLISKWFYDSNALPFCKKT